MNWRYAIYLSKIKEFLLQQSDTQQIIILLQKKLKKIKGSTVEKQSVVNSFNNFKNGTIPTGEYFEAYLQVINELVEDGYSIADVLNGTYKNEREIELRQLLLEITKGKSLPGELKVHINNRDVLLELTNIFYKIIKICIENKNRDPERNLTRFRHFLEIIDEQNGNNL